ncbi:MAG: transposase [Candidatus Saccharimonadales bacterium]
MPSKNAVREYDIRTYYHVYNRGASKQSIFLDDQDKINFLSLLQRHLDPDDTSRRSDGLPYPIFDIELLAYCLMGNHFHLLLYQNEDTAAISNFMKSIDTAYTMYFNKKYRASGHLFQGPFKSARITDEAYLLHITRYIHMNPRYYQRYRWSSISAYLGKAAPAWLKIERIADMRPAEYRNFLADYESRKAELELLKNYLAK